jgi:hypothetical protein
MIDKLDGKIDKLREDLYEVREQTALVKRDRAWGKWIAGIFGSAITLVLDYVVRRQ